MQLSGIHDYGSTDYMGTCRSQYGAAIGFIGADGTPQMLPMAPLPTDVSAGLAVVHDQWVAGGGVGAWTGATR